MAGRITRLMLCGGAEARHLSALPMLSYTGLQAARRVDGWWVDGRCMGGLGGGWRLGKARAHGYAAKQGTREQHLHAGMHDADNGSCRSTAAVRRACTRAPVAARHGLRLREVLAQQTGHKGR